MLIFDGLSGSGLSFTHRRCFSNPCRNEQRWKAGWVRSAARIMCSRGEGDMTGTDLWLQRHKTPTTFLFRCSQEPHNWRGLHWANLSFFLLCVRSLSLLHEQKSRPWNLIFIQLLWSFITLGHKYLTSFLFFFFLILLTLPFPMSRHLSQSGDTGSTVYCNVSIFRSVMLLQLFFSPSLITYR